MTSHRTLHCRLAAVGACLLLGLAGAQAVSAAPPPSPYVTRSGSSLMLGGAPYRFTGLNIYNANSTGSCWYDMVSGSTLGDSLAAIGPGKEAMRAWFFQSLATRNGVRDWTAFDHTLAVARSHGVKVIVTLGQSVGRLRDGWLPERAVVLERLSHAQGPGLDAALRSVGRPGGRPLPQRSDDPGLAAHERGRGEAVSRQRAAA